MASENFSLQTYLVVHISFPSLFNSYENRDLKFLRYKLNLL